MPNVFIARLTIQLFDCGYHSSVHYFVGHYFMNHEHMYTSVLLLTITHYLVYTLLLHTSFIICLNRDTVIISLYCVMVYKYIIFKFNDKLIIQLKLVTQL